MTAATLSDRISAAGLKPLEFSTNEDAPQFFGKIVDAWVAATCLDGVVHKYENPAELGAANGEGTSLEDLVDIRNRAVAS